jgi:hypothetical protein
MAGCDSESKPAATATLLNNEDVHRAIQGLDSQIGSLEADVEEFDNGDWRDVVPRVKTKFRTDGNDPNSAVL